MIPPELGNAWKTLENRPKTHAKIEMGEHLGNLKDWGDIIHGN
jgi:hypothetical protein